MRSALLALALVAVALAEDRNAPTPYTAAQIRAACPDGRVSTYAVEVPDRDPFRQTFRFANGDEKGTDFTVALTTKEGKPLGEPRTSRQTWKQLQEHASYPAAQTKVTDAAVKTPAGTFACRLYTVTTKQGESTTVARMWFAEKLPGPPVKMVREVDGEAVFTMTLVAHEPGGDKQEGDPEDE